MHCGFSVFALTGESWSSTGRARAGGAVTVSLCLQAGAQVLNYTLGECKHQKGTWWVPAKVARSIPSSALALPGDQDKQTIPWLQVPERP